MLGQARAHGKTSQRKSYVKHALDVKNVSAVGCDDKNQVEKLLGSFQQVFDVRGFSISLALHAPFRVVLLLSS